MNDSQVNSAWINAFRILFLLAGIPLVLWLASMLWYAWLKADWKTVGVFGWLDGALLYWQGDPAALSRSTSIWVTLSLALIAVYGVPIYAALTGQIKFGKPKLHGDARFANRREITKAKLNGADPLGVVIGRYNGQVLTFPGQQFVLVAAPTRSGKGVGIVIPNLLSYQGSMVVLDIKQENYDYTAGYRSRVLEQDCWLFNPFADERDENKVAQPRTHRYNFLEAIESPPFRIGDILSLGQSLWPTGGKDSFWNDSARNLFLGIVLVLLELRDAKAGSPWSPDISEAQRDEIPPLPVTMGEVLRQSSGGGSGQPIKKYFKDFFLGKFKHCLSSECLDSLNNFLSASDDTLSNILSTFNAPLAIWRNPVVDAATSACDFQLSDVRKKKMTVFIGVKPKFLDDARVILNVMFSQLVALNTRELPKDNPELKYPCMLLMDEFTAIGKVTIIAKAVSYIAGYNLRLVPIIQSISQLESVYGKEDTRTFTTNHAMQVLYPPKDDKDAKEYSEMLGYYTYKSSSSSRSKSILNPRESSENLSDQRRALLMPQEIKELGTDREIITLENTKAIFCHKIRYYEEADFKDKVEPAPEIPVIDLKIPRVKFDDLAKHPAPAKESDLIGEGTDIRYAPGVEPAGIEDDFESQESQWSQTDSGRRDPVANLGRLVPAKNRPTAEEIAHNLKESRSLVAMVASADASVTPKDPSISEAERLKAIASNMALTKADTNTQAEIDTASAHSDVFGEALTESEIQESFEEWQ